MPVIPYGRQDISREDIAAVVEVLQSDWLTQGPMVERFESAVAAYCAVPDAVAVCNATAALHLACAALDLTRGDLLWTVPNTFVASANCARYCGAEVDFVDIDPKTYNLCCDALEVRLKQARAQGRLPKVLVPVHFAGLACDLRRIHALAQEYGFKVVEDASHAIGGSYSGAPVGDGKWSDLTIFSMHPVKIVTTGEGGVLTTRSAKLAERLRRLRSHGITRDTRLLAKPEEGPWYYEQIELGFNFRLTDLQCALGASQMTRISQFIAKRRSIAERYHLLLKHLPLRTPSETADSRSAWHLYVIQLEDPGVRKQVVERMRKAGILVNVHYIPVHLQPYYRKLGFAPGDFPAAEDYYRRAVSLPMYYGLTEDMQDRVVAELQAALA